MRVNDLNLKRVFWLLQIVFSVVIFILFYGSLPLWLLIGVSLVTSAFLIGVLAFFLAILAVFVDALEIIGFKDWLKKK